MQCQKADQSLYHYKGVRKSLSYYVVCVTQLGLLLEENKILSYSRNDKVTKKIITMG